MNKKVTIIILLITIFLFFLILQKNNITTKEKTEESGGEYLFDCPYIEKNIGEEHGGGVIAYCDKEGKKGIITTPSDQSLNISWGCNGVYIDNISKDYGDGKNNTNFIIKECDESPIAASICHNLTFNRYDDWFLPSQDELNYLYINRSKIGGFSNAYYWSSTESNFISAIRQSFNLGVQNSSSKSGTYRVRCIRYF